MPDEARLWIYQASRALNEREVDFVKHHTSQFLSQWQAHGQGLKASFTVEYAQFLIISVDESFSQASGCSIDSSVHLIKALESELNVSFMTTSQVAFLIDDQVALFPFNTLKSRVQENLISPSTMIFDNTVKNIGELRAKWLVPSQSSWVNRFFS